MEPNRTAITGSKERGIRTTRVFKRVNGHWRQMHHHGSFDDPNLLKNYQAAVLGRNG
jgi:hypothetical protein